MNRSEYERFMEVCIRLAEKGRGYVSPNPLVGAVLVKGNRIVAQGYHRKFGGPHAEAECIRNYRGDFQRVTLFVNLEPCAHYGKTPPCADLIVRAGIRTVVVGSRDPNPIVNGRGIRKLREAGIRVISGVLEDEAMELNRAFITFVTKQRPLVHVKIAQTLDGKVAARTGPFTKITGYESQRLVHRLRSEHDAVLVGAGTIRSDDPRLSVRLTSGRDPAVVVMDGRLSLDSGHRLWKSARHRRVLVISSLQAMNERPGRVRELTSYGVELLPLKSSGYHVSLERMLKELHTQGISSVLVEAGPDLAGQFLAEGRADLLSVLIAPKILSSGISAFQSLQAKAWSSRMPAARLSVSRVGRDALLQYDFGRR